MARAAEYNFSGLDQATGELTQAVDAVLADTDDG
jgi:hypothetical protein